MTSAERISEVSPGYMRGVVVGRTGGGVGLLLPLPSSSTLELLGLGDLDPLLEPEEALLNIPSAVLIGVVLLADWVVVEDGTACMLASMAGVL